MEAESPRRGTTEAPVAAVSVAISTFGRPDALARCLRSLAVGSMLPAEVVVVDQSPDRSARAVVDAIDGLRVEYVPQAAIGLGIAQNEAVRRTKWPVIAVLDDDCVAGTDWIAEVSRLLGREGSADVVGGRILPLDDGGAGLQAVSSRTSTIPRGFQGRSRPWDVGSGNNFALRREWFDRVGGCNERLGPGSPGRGAVDIDLFYRLLRAGARVRYEPSLLVYHERKSRSERLARRVPYGHGMGAACATWLRQRDWYAARVLATWLVFRARLFVGALSRRRWGSAWEEMLVLGGTARGVVHGLRRTEPVP